VLHFAPIDLEAHGELCVRFKKETFLLSYGSTDPFHEVYDGDPENYLAWLREGLAHDPNSRVHVWNRSTLVGQCELSEQARFPQCGYVHLYYLVPEFRGLGLGAQIDAYATQFFTYRNVGRARLSVGLSNRRAISFYSRNGWVPLGQREDRPASLYMEKRFAPRPPSVPAA
jgi:GNAT superfamily N-acetyltransferase